MKAPALLPAGAAALAVLCAAAAPGPARALGSVTGYDTLAAHPEWITGVQTCGTWGDPAQGGYFRVLTAIRYAQSLLFVDMVEVDPASGTPRWQRGFGVPEINNDHAETTLVGTLRCTPDGPGRIRVRSAAESGHDGRRFRLCVRVDAAAGTVQYRDSQSGAPADGLCGPDPAHGVQGRSRR